ncbi:hypothetical protein GBN67_12030 [Acinetobacter johnsonii]|jgi:hypothetical protein|uniref:hypothetical protein n=1 Tax=Acinetobacter johnsonii TaxID=40214 RepID=UPI001F43E74D|nr:hypothetical protein [Acinetobacter johnsonii]UIZ95580.1 hypothetical protein GBN67_12030 [Acinetobacter johnsonii]
MQLRLQVSGANGVGIFSPETTEGLESILGNKVILLKEPRSELGLGGVVNVFKTAQLLNMHLDIGDKDDSWDFLLIPYKPFDKSILKIYKIEALWKIRRSYESFPRWSQVDYEEAVEFFNEISQVAGWPSTTGNPSGGGRDNNSPAK